MSNVPTHDAEALRDYLMARKTADEVARRPPVHGDRKLIARYPIERCTIASVISNMDNPPSATVRIFLASMPRYPQIGCIPGGKHSLQEKADTMMRELSMIACPNGGREKMKSTMKPLLILYAALGLITMIFQIYFRYPACLESSGCALSFGKGIVWSVIWPAYWVHWLRL